MVNAPLNKHTLTRLAQALTFWERRGYQFVNLPWLAAPQFVQHTRPPEVTTEDPSTRHGMLLASGEQAFLELWEHGELQPNQGYVGWTPCFREELHFDETHHFYFMKAELFYPVPDAPDVICQQMLDGSIHLFEALAERPLNLVQVHYSAEQVDLELDRLEVGSYGIRRLPGGALYVYGTALAEPRFSTALNHAGVR